MSLGLVRRRLGRGVLPWATTPSILGSAEPRRAHASTGKAAQAPAITKLPRADRTLGMMPVMASRDGTRLLIATGEAAASEEELPPLVRALIDTASELLVMTPMLISRLQWLASDTDRARYEADERLSNVLGHVETLAPEAVSAAGRRRHAVHGLRRRDPRLPAGSHPDRPAQRDHSGWQERGLSTRSGSSASRSPSSSSTGRGGRRSGPSGNDGGRGVRLAPRPGPQRVSASASCARCRTREPAQAGCAAQPAAAARFVASSTSACWPAACI